MKRRIEFLQKIHQKAAFNMSHQTACVNMIQQQLRTGAVVDEAIIDLYRDIPRSAFVPSNYISFAYSDMHIPLAHHQCMMTPLEEALLLQCLQLKGHETVLEVGTGTGFLTALLSRLCQRVVSVDCFAQMTKSAHKALTAHDCLNVELITADASQGWLDLAPYDVIIFTGGMQELNETQRLQVLPGGKLFAIIGSKPVMQGRLYTMDNHQHRPSDLVFQTVLPSLILPYQVESFVF